MSLTPAITTTILGSSWRTSLANLPRIWSERSPFTPRLRTFQSLWPRMSQYEYWLFSSPAPLGGDSRGERNPGVPAVVESPSPTILIVTPLSHPQIERLSSSGALIKLGPLRPAPILSDSRPARPL